MKKIIFILIVTLNLQFTFSQSNFSQGFSDGYKKGYCQNQSKSCILPLPPISPIPGVNENINSYQDGLIEDLQMV